MRNFGYTVAAYTVLWGILLGFVLMTWRRQAALSARLQAIETTLQRADPASSTKARAT